jgi:hypothetical protein
VSTGTVGSVTGWGGIPHDDAPLRTVLKPQVLAVQMGTHLLEPCATCGAPLPAYRFGRPATYCSSS